MVYISHVSVSLMRNSNVLNRAYPAHNYIELNLSRQLNLKILAEYSHVTPPYLSKTFKKEVGTTVTDYITSTRIHSSLRLLTTTNLSIQEVAFYVGMEDYNYYTKIFKKMMGCPPSEYRRNLQKE